MMRRTYERLIESVWKFVFPEDEIRAPKIAGDILRIEVALANVKRDSNILLIYIFPN